MCSGASNWLSSPHVESHGISRGNRHANSVSGSSSVCFRVAPALPSRRSVNTIMEMCNGFLWCRLFELDNKAVQ